jgi:hypothetical protein
MRKLRLEIDELRVETFDTDARGDGRGTVHGRSGTEMTRCFGLCGEHTEEAFGCGGGGTEGCTMNPYIDDCYSYAQQCPPTQYPSWSCDYTCGADVGETICAGNCTDTCTV